MSTHLMQTGGRGRQALALAAAGFTLIEVLISIIILALGLLGIGVVFPVVIRQQRISTDEVRGVVEARSAADAMLKRFELQNQDVWQRWRNYRQANPGLNEYRNGEWGIPAYDDDGTLTMKPDGAGGNNMPRFTARDRLSSDEQYVWDMAVQPIPDGDNLIGNERLRIAVFVRRVDARRRDGGLPVAVEDGTGLPAVDRRQGSANVRYAAPITVDAEFRMDGQRVDRRQLWFTGGGNENTAISIASQPGMKLVDSHGNIHTVVRRVEDEQGDVVGVRIDPPLPATITEQVVNRNSQVQLVCTPQVPAAVYIVEVTP